MRLNVVSNTGWTHLIVLFPPICTRCRVARCQSRVRQGIEKMTRPTCLTPLSSREVYLSLRRGSVGDKTAVMERRYGVDLTCPKSANVLVQVVAMLPNLAKSEELANLQSNPLPSQSHTYIGHSRALQLLNNRLQLLNSYQTTFT